MKKSITDILSFKSSLDKKKSTIDDLEREASYFRRKRLLFRFMNII